MAKIKIAKVTPGPKPNTTWIVLDPILVTTTDMKAGESVEVSISKASNTDPKPSPGPLPAPSPVPSSPPKIARVVEGTGAVPNDTGEKLQRSFEQMRTAMSVRRQSTIRERQAQSQEDIDVLGVLPPIRVRRRR